MIMIGSNSVVKVLIRYSSSRLKYSAATVELLVERSGLFADLEHLTGGTGEQLGLDQRLREPAPSSICWRAISSCSR